MRTKNGSNHKFHGSLVFSSEAFAKSARLKFLFFCVMSSSDEDRKPKKEKKRFSATPTALMWLVSKPSRSRSRSPKKEKARSRKGLYGNFDILFVFRFTVPRWRQIGEVRDDNLLLHLTCVVGVVVGPNLQPARRLQRPLAKLVLNTLPCSA